MCKWRMKSLMALLIALSLLLPATFSLTVTDTEANSSDRYDGEVEFQIISQDNPFGAVKVNEFTTEAVKAIMAASVDHSLRVNRTRLSMTEVRTVEIEAAFSEAVIPSDLLWTFGGVPLEEWRIKRTANTDGGPLITFEVEPYFDENSETLKAILKFNLPFNTVNLQGRPFPRTFYPALYGSYTLKVEDKTSSTAFSENLIYKPYDSFHSYDEIIPELDQIISASAEDRYIGYDIIGYSAEGREVPFGMITRAQADINTYFEKTLPLMLEDPASLQTLLLNGNLGSHKSVIWFNNLHSDEAPGVDAQLDLFRSLSTEDTIIFETKNAEGEIVSEALDVQALLDEFILVFNFVQNPDGRYYNTRTTVSGFDPNRDMSFQTQVECSLAAGQIAKWTPLIFNDFHGFVSAFLIEPCTAPHDPNYEYDLLMDGMIPHAHAMGEAGIANTKYNRYIIPQFDYGDGWDDASPVYGAMYALLHGSMGHTIEMPELNQDSNDAVYFAGIGSLHYASQNRERLMHNQLEIFRRGVEGIDAAELVDHLLIDANFEAIGRPRGDYENFFPEYYVIPVEASLQKNALAAYKMAEYLLHNGVRVEITTEEVFFNDTSYPAGSFLVPMRQAKRGFANTVLYDGSDFSDFAAMYAEVTSHFPQLKGFDLMEVREENLFDGKSEKIDNVAIPSNEVPRVSEYVILRCSNNDAIRAVNDLLNTGVKVGLITEAGETWTKGDYLVKRSELKNLERYYLDMVPASGTVSYAKINKPLLASYGSELIFLLKGLNFESVTLSEANVIVDSSGSANTTAVKTQITDFGIPYVGIGGNSVNSLATTNLLIGLSRGRTANNSYEGVLKSVLDTDNVILGSYSTSDILYNKSASWIEGVPTTSTVLASISNEDDFFLAGWWPNHYQVKGKAYILTDQIGEAKITLFANHLFNRAHPEHQFRMLANAIYWSLATDTDQISDEAPVVEGAVNKKEIWNLNATIPYKFSIPAEGEMLTLKLMLDSETVKEWSVGKGAGNIRQLDLEGNYLLNLNTKSLGLTAGQYQLITNYILYGKPVTSTTQIEIQ